MMRLIIFEVKYNEYIIYPNIKENAKKLLNGEKIQVERRWIDEQGYARYRREWKSIEC
jgi:hypothetical protein